MATQHKVYRVAGDQELQSKLDELTATGWEILSVMIGQKGDVNQYILVVRKATPR